MVCRTEKKGTPVAQSITREAVRVNTHSSPKRVYLRGPLDKMETY